MVVNKCGTTCTFLGLSLSFCKIEVKKTVSKVLSMHEGVGWSWMGGGVEKCSFLIWVLVIQVCQIVKIYKAV